MAIKTYKPTSNGRRNMTGFTFSEITTDKPEKSLLQPLHKRAAETTKVGQQFVSAEAVISVNIASLILNVTKMEYQDALIPSNTIQTDPLHCINSLSRW